MSIAICPAGIVTTHQTSAYRGHSSAIGDLVKLADRLPTEIPELLTPADRSRWAALVYSSLRNAANNLETPNKPLRARLLCALNYLAKRGSVTHPITRNTWGKLYELCLMCAHEQDWSAPAGPVMGASNKTLEDRWNIQNARRVLRELARWGMIIPFCAKGNGHRSYRRTASGPIGSGWSLAPLRILVKSIEDLVQTEEHLRMKRIELPRRTTDALRSASTLLRSVTDCSWANEAEQKLGMLRAQRDQLRNADIAELQAICSDAEDFLLEVEQLLQSAIRCPDFADESSTRPDDTVHYQYNDSTNQGESSSSAEEEYAHDGRSLPASRSLGDTSKPGFEDPYGIIRSGFSWRETSWLFPFTHDLINLRHGPTRSTPHELARLIGVSNNIADASVAALGIAATTLCLLITGQLVAESKIHKSADAYMRGIVRKAADGDLNIGHTVFARRRTAEHKPLVAC